VDQWCRKLFSRARVMGDLLWGSLKPGPVLSGPDAGFRRSVVMG